MQSTWPVVTAAWPPVRTLIVWDAPDLPPTSAMRDVSAKKDSSTWTETASRSQNVQVNDLKWNATLTYCSSWACFSLAVPHMPCLGQVDPVTEETYTARVQCWTCSKKNNDDKCYETGGFETCYYYNVSLPMWFSLMLFWLSHLTISKQYTRGSTGCVSARDRDPLRWHPQDKPRLHGKEGLP